MQEAATGSVDTSPRPGTLQEATDAFEMLLSPPQVTPKAAKQTPKAPLDDAEATDDESVDAEASPGEEEPTGEVELDEDGNPVEPGTEEDDAPPPETLYTVTIDGKEEQVRASELIAGYQRNQSYTRKSMALAEERKAFENDRATTQQERSEYAQLLPKLRAALTVPEPNWEEIKAKTPEQFPTAWAEWQQHQAKVQNIALEERRVNAQLQQEFQAKREELVNEQRNAFLSKVSAWRDPKVAAREAGEIKSVLESVGFSGDELNIYDHRALLLARMAAKYAKGLTAKAGLVQKRADGAPIVKSGAGPAKKVAPGAAAQAKFNKSGKLTDFASVLEGMLS